MTSALAQENAVQPAAAPRRGKGFVLALWLLAAIPLLLFLSGPPAQRTQEARVLETARQMLGHGWHAWLIPTLNGEIRVRKPPLAYWMAGASFSIFGVSEWAGRLPTAMVSWLTLAATYLIARRLFGRAAGLLSAACLLGSYLFFRQGRLAETDAPAVLLATIAVDLFWRATDRKNFLLFHAAAAATGLSLFAKQGPGWFAPLFFVLYALVRRKPRTLWQFIYCGAPITLILIAGWWYGYAAASEGLTQFRRELAEVTEGIDHPAPFYYYFPMLLLAAAPWSPLAIGSLIAAARRAKADPRLAGLLVWAAADFVPLCFVGNKQEHYLLALMPPLMILVGWLIAEAGRPGGDAALARSVKLLVQLTIIGTFVAALTLPLADEIYRGQISRVDVILALAIAAATLPAWITINHRGMFRGAAALAVTWGLALPVLLGVWTPAIAPSDIRQTAMEINELCGSGPYVFYGGDTSLPLCFALREEIPRIDDQRPDLLQAAATDQPNLTVIWEVPQHGPGPQLPPDNFVQIGPQFGAQGQAFRIFRKRTLGFGGSR
jgi:4-amino-4-deoxy-L-arabinose transferase-like glycosyltransferase